MPSIIGIHPGFACRYLIIIVTTLAVNHCSVVQHFQLDDSSSVTRTELDVDRPSVDQPTFADSESVDVRLRKPSRQHRRHHQQHQGSAAAADDSFPEQTTTSSADVVGTATGNRRNVRWSSNIDQPDTPSKPEERDDGWNKMASDELQHSSDNSRWMDSPRTDEVEVLPVPHVVVDGHTQQRESHATHMHTR